MAASSPVKSPAAAALALAALGVVFGDIGTSPLYTLTACFQISGAVATSQADVLGIASCLVWALIIVVCIKYISVIMRVDHDGEGGILALLALASRKRAGTLPVAGGVITLTVVIGAAMLLGDGSITPAISVISAMEGLKMLSPSAAPLIVPLSVVILIVLFIAQRRGTETIGRFFGPIMVGWFIAIAVAGTAGIVRAPVILRALDPVEAMRFMGAHGLGGFFVLGGVVLAVTGVEALYADLSHFGRRPIALAWYLVLFPALVLCYLGEAATVLVTPGALDSPYFALTTGAWLVPSILLATVATVIASQALISGAFTLVEQAIALGLVPRMRVIHTSEHLRGQVYVPAVNALLMIGCIALVCAFKSSDRLASAFGLAVSCTMLATSFAWYAVVTGTGRWKHVFAVPMLVAFVATDGSFVIAGLPKFMDGGWIPFLVSAVITLITLIWMHGRMRLLAALSADQTSIVAVRDELQRLDAETPPSGAAVAPLILLTPRPWGVPFFGTHAWVRHQILRANVILLTIAQDGSPYVDEDGRASVIHVTPRLHIVEAKVGYMEAPRIAPIVAACAAHGLAINIDESAFMYAVPKVAETKTHALQAARRWIFLFFLKNARPLPEDLEIPPNQRIGLTVEVVL